MKLLLFEHDVAALLDGLDDASARCLGADAFAFLEFGSERLVANVFVNFLDSLEQRCWRIA